MIDRRTLRDARLSYQARGLLAYCLSLSDTARVTLADLIAHAPDGSQRVQTALHELSEHGYAELQTIRDRSGHIRGRQWIIYERPDLHADKPVSGT